MEERLRMGRQSRATRVLIVRAGRLFRAAQHRQFLVLQRDRQAGQAGEVAHLAGPERLSAMPGPYLPDYGETVARLADKDAEFSAFETFHFGGHWFEDGHDFADEVRRAAGAPDAPVRALPWLVVQALVARRVQLFRELAEMKYLWDVPVRLDNREAGSVAWRRTAYARSARRLLTTLDAMGCLPETIRRQSELNLRDC
jgi:hypothetical protein